MDRIADGTSRKNLELKARIARIEEAEERARRLGATEGGLLRQVDTYFDAPSGRLKLREINGNEAQLIGYDRPEQDAQRYSQFRVVAVTDAAGMKALLTEAMGLRGTVSKHRRLYHWNDCRIHLDEVEGLGSFVEFEVLSQGNTCSDWDRMETLMLQFGLRDQDAIRASYSDLLDL